VKKRASLSEPEGGSTPSSAPCSTTVGAAMAGCFASAASIEASAGSPGAAP
jgi:hypothetical protein